MLLLPKCGLVLVLLLLISQELMLLY